MNELKAISKKTKIKILKYAVALLREHGSNTGDRCCQDWSISADEIIPPETSFTNKEKQRISFNYEQWNSDGEDYDPEHTYFNDEMVVSFMLSRAIELMIEDAELTDSYKADNNEA